MSDCKYTKIFIKTFCFFIKVGVYDAFKEIIFMLLFVDVYQVFNYYLYFLY